jgi:hypothetical protein
LSVGGSLELHWCCCWSCVEGVGSFSEHLITNVGGGYVGIGIDEELKALICETTVVVRILEDSNKLVEEETAKDYIR